LVGEQVGSPHFDPRPMMPSKPRALCQSAAYPSVGAAVNPGRKVVVSAARVGDHRLARIREPVFEQSTARDASGGCGNCLRRAKPDVLVH
jgi:hypothetical protein